MATATRAVRILTGFALESLRANANALRAMPLSTTQWANSLMATQQTQTSSNFTSKARRTETFSPIAQAIAVALLAGLSKAGTMFMFTELSEETGLTFTAPCSSVAASTP